MERGFTSSEHLLELGEQPLALGLGEFDFVDVARFDCLIERRRLLVEQDLSPHVLGDHDPVAGKHSAGNRDELREIRANAFAAHFLMPESGVRSVLADRGKLDRSKIGASILCQLQELLSRVTRSNTGEMRVRCPSDLPAGCVRWICLTGPKVLTSTCGPRSEWRAQLTKEPMPGPAEVNLAKRLGATEQVSEQILTLFEA